MRKTVIRSDEGTAKQFGPMRSAVGWLALVTLATLALWAYSETDRPVLRSRVYKLRHIDSETAKGMLQRLRIGTEYNTLSEDVLIVTSDRTMDLVKATSVMTLADRSASVELRVLMVIDEQTPAPRPQELAARLRSLTLGTLTQAPPINAPKPAIVDVLDETVFALAETEVLAMIETAIEAWRAETAPKPADETPDPEQPQTAASLEDVAAELFERMGQEDDEAARADDAPDETPAVIGEEETIDAAPVDTSKMETEDFLAQELIEALDDQARRSVATPPAVEAQPQEAPAASDEQARLAEMAETVEDDTLRAALEMLMRSAQAAPAEPIDIPDSADIAEAPDADIADAGVEAETEPPATAPEPAPTRAVLSPERAAEELELTITLPEEVEIEALVELVGKQLGLNYMYDPAILRGQKVMLKVHDGRIKVGEMYSLLESALRFRGFVMTRRDRLVTIARQQDADAFDPILRVAGDPIQPGDVVVSSIFSLQHVTPATAQELLTQMKLGSTFNAIVETGTLIVTDYAFRMDRIAEVIAMIDVEGRPKRFQYRQLRYMQAADLVPKVQALAEQIKDFSVSVPEQPATPQIDPRTRRPVQQQRPARPDAQVGDKQTLYLEADERTNRVLVIGYAEEISLVNELIDSLDVAGFDLRFVQEYVIQYVEATEVITVLNELGLARVTVTDPRQQQQPQRPQPTRPGQPQQQQQQQQPQQQPQRVSGDTSTLEPHISLRAATNSLLVNATEEQHKAIELVILHVDVMQHDQRTIREYEIQFVDTESIMNTLAELGIISPRQTVAQQQAQTRAGQQTPQTQQARAQQTQQETGGFMTPTLDGADREITAQEPQIAVLPATNSLLVYATPRQHASISMVIAHADRQLDRMLAPYMVYALENQDPEELAEILNTLIKETVEEMTDTARAAAPDARIQTRSSQVATLPSGEEQRIRIVADPKTYSLVVYANQRNQQWVGELIRELDEYRPQVLLDVTLVEITRDDAFQFQLDMIAKTFGGAMQTGWAVGEGYDFTSRNLLEARSRGGSGDIFFSSDKVQALLNIVEDRGYGRVMAKPKLLVNDNQEGEISTETTKSIAQVKTNVIPPTATTGPTTTSDVVFQDYIQGVNLAIRPHISKGDMLRLEITMNRTDFGDDVTVEIDEVVSDGQGGLRTLTRRVPGPPDRFSTDIFTTATVPDGATIILGGLERLSQTKVHSKVPILGDLPLLGGLFRRINNVDDQSRMYIFVKAEILRPADQLEGLEDMRRVSERNRRAFEELEERFQDMQSWPGIKDRPMDPIRVLEED